MNVTSLCSIFGNPTIAEEPKGKPEEKGVRGPTALLALAMLPLGIRRLLNRKM